MISARWQGVIALLLLIIISYIDRVNISMMILNPDFSAYFHLNENRMLQGMLMTGFLVGYGLSAILLTPLMESRLHNRYALLCSVLFWSLICAASPLVGSLVGLLISRVVLGVAEGPLFSLKTRYINENFGLRELGKPNAVTAMGVSLGLALGFPLVNALLDSLGWAGSFYALGVINFVLGGGLVWVFIPVRDGRQLGTRLRFCTVLRLAWRTPLLGWILLVEIATLSYLWGSSSWLPAWLHDEHHLSLHSTGWLAAIPFLLSLVAKYVGGLLLDKLRPNQAPLLFISGGLSTALAICGLMLSQHPVWLTFWLLSANACWGIQGAAIPAMVQYQARHEVVGSAYGLINGVGNLVAAFIPLLMGVLMHMLGSISAGFSLLVLSQLVTLFAGTMLLLRLRAAALTINA